MCTYKTSPSNTVEQHHRLMLLIDFNIQLPVARFATMYAAAILV